MTDFNHIMTYTNKEAGGVIKYRTFRGWTTNIAEAWHFTTKEEYIANFILCQSERFAMVNNTMPDIDELVSI